ncbi:repressor of nif and glnA expression [Paenibacillus sp. PvR148]
MEKMCGVLKVSRSGYYKWRASEASEQCKRKELLTECIKRHFHDSDEIYGSPRIHNELVKEGWIVSERTVGLIMREQGLHSCMARKFRVMTTDSNHDMPIAPNVLQQDFASNEAE